MKFAIISVFVFYLIDNARTLDNGLALTPPMGWLTWERYRCIIDCDARPDECISEKLILSVADLLVSEGYADAGYNYVGIDDCWMEHERDDKGVLVPDRKRFPNGMKYIGDYLHDKGLKFGIYEDYGRYTCEGYPGIIDHMEIDANTFAEWGADYIKLDGCYVDINLMDDGYPQFGRFLNNTGRPILYSCSWPVYQEYAGMEPNFTSIIENCNMWRNYGDIQDSWSSTVSIMNYFGKNSKKLATYAGPGHWNDPDMLIIGNYGLSYDQSKVQMAVWAILAAPLLISTDLRVIESRYRDILLNEDIIEVNQDSLGRAGILIIKKTKLDVWRREVNPVQNNEPSYVFAFVNLRDDGAPVHTDFKFEDLELKHNHNDYEITDLYYPDQTTWKVKMVNSSSVLSVMMNPTGVHMLKFVRYDENRKQKTK